MKLDELIRKLTEIQTDLQDSGIDTSETTVLVGAQPIHPITGIVAGAVSGEELHDHVEEGLNEFDRKAVWLAADAIMPSVPHNFYAPKALWDVAR